MSFFFSFSEDCYTVHVEIENEDMELQIADTAGEVRDTLFCVNKARF